jgi:hypothetical protein
MFGDSEVKLRSLTDAAGIFRRNERDRLEDEMERIRRERPTLGAPTPGRNDTTTPLDMSTPLDEVEPTVAA